MQPFGHHWADFFVLHMKKLKSIESVATRLIPTKSGLGLEAPDTNFDVLLVVSVSDPAPIRLQLTDTAH